MTAKAHAAICWIVGRPKVAWLATTTKLKWTVHGRLFPTTRSTTWSRRMVALTSVLRDRWVRTRALYSASSCRLRADGSADFTKAVPTEPAAAPPALPGNGSSPARRLEGCESRSTRAAWGVGSWPSVVTRRPLYEALDGANVTTQSPPAASHLGRNRCGRAVPPTTRILPVGSRSQQADTLDRRRAARGRARQLDHLQCRQRHDRARRLRAGDGRLLRFRRTPDRFLTHVWLVPEGDWLRSRQAQWAAKLVLGRQGLDPLRCPRAGPDRSLPPIVGRASVRSAAGPQSPLLGGAPAHAVRHEGRRPAPLCRNHHLGRAQARRSRADHARAAARFRAGHLQHSRPPGRRSYPSAGAGPRHRRDR